MGEIGDMFRAMMRAGEAAELERATEAAPLVRGGFVRPGRRDASPEYSGDASRPAAGDARATRGRRGKVARARGRRATMSTKRAGGSAPDTPEVEAEEPEPTT